MTMRTLIQIGMSAAIAIVSAVTTLGQTAAANTVGQTGVASQGQAIGELLTIDLATKQVTLKTDAGQTLLVLFSDKTVYLRVKPGEKTLDQAVSISPSELRTGDRVYLRGRFFPDAGTMSARSLLVMSHTDIAQKHERERNEWLKRGISGSVTALATATKEITLLMRSPEGLKPIILDASSADVRFRRYAADSVKFSDAKTSSFNELNVGDQLRALGDKGSDGSRFKPEEVVSGSFRTVAGTVIDVDPTSNKMRIRPLGDAQPLTVAINKDSLLRRISPNLSTVLASRLRGVASAASTAPGVVTNSHPVGSNRSQGTKGNEVSFQEALEQSPILAFSELKAGDKVMLSSATEAEASPVIAIVFITGVDPIFELLTRQTKPGSTRGSSITTGLPADVLSGIGSP